MMREFFPRARARREQRRLGLGRPEQRQSERMMTSLRPGERNVFA